MKRPLILVSLIILFSAPGLFAYLFYTHPLWLGKVTTNKGYLIPSPILLTALKDPILGDNDSKLIDLNPKSAPNLNNPTAERKKEKLNFQPNSGKKWQLILWYPQECDQACIEKVNQLAHIRLALGRKLYQVDQYLILKQNRSMLSDSNKRVLQEQAINILYLSPTDNELKLWENKPQIFIANPEHYLILNYPLDTNPKDLFHDINQLLKV